MAAFALPVAADDEPQNNSCPGEAYTPDGTGFEYGTMSSSDQRDYYSFSVSANQMIDIEMNPGYSPDDDLDIYLYEYVPGQGCFLKDYSNAYGHGIERIQYQAPSSGAYSVEVRWYSGGGLAGYDLRVWRYWDFYESCHAEASDYLPTGSCSVQSPSCATSNPCHYRVTAYAQGTGQITLESGGHSCSGLGGCTFSYDVDSYGFNAVCSVQFPSVGYDVGLRCEVAFR